MKKRIYSSFLFFFIFSIVHIYGQQVKVVISPDREDWIYSIGEEARFRIQVFDGSSLIENVSIDYEIGPEFLPTDKKRNVLLEKGEFLLKSTMEKPGFLRCNVAATVEGKEYRSLVTVGYDADKISPVATDPADFDDFWTKAINQARKVPLEPKMRLLENNSASPNNIYEVSFQNERFGSRIYGILSIPKKQGKYPAILEVPGAGIRPYSGSNIEGGGDDIITLQIGIHGIPVTLAQEVYDNLSKGALYNYMHINKNDRDAYYYKRVYLGCIRAVDFIHTLPEFDGNNLGVMGGSQGGALSVVTAALDSRIKFLAVNYPALCDLTGFLNSRAGGWPRFFRDSAPRQKEVETLSYFDVVNFARRLKVPGWYSWGFNDTTCPPTSMYAAYNIISAEKTLDVYKETGHRTIPVQRKVRDKWIIEQLKSNPQ